MLAFVRDLYSIYVLHHIFPVLFLFSVVIVCTPPAHARPLEIDLNYDITASEIGRGRQTLSEYTTHQTNRERAMGWPGNPLVNG